jgi:hypothetical protein
MNFRKFLQLVEFGVSGINQPGQAAKSPMKQGSPQTKPVTPNPPPPSSMTPRGNKVPQGPEVPGGPGSKNGVFPAPERAVGMSGAGKPLPQPSEGGPFGGGGKKFKGATQSQGPTGLTPPVSVSSAQQGPQPVPGKPASMKL